MKKGDEIRNFLCDLPVGASAKISRISHPQLEVALVQLGVTPGDHFRISNMAPLGGPIAISINGTKVSMRRKDARSVLVHDIVINEYDDSKQDAAV